jgi:hypothetical protein
MLSTHEAESLSRLFSCYCSALQLWPATRPWTWYLPVARLGRHITQSGLISAVKAPIRNLLPMAAGGVIHYALLGGRITAAA